MRIASTVALVMAGAVALSLTGAAARAEPTAKTAPDLTFTWTEGEMSRDMSLSTTTITVTGTKVHYAREYSGRMSGMPGTKPVEADGIVKDPKRLAAAIAAFDKIPVPKPANGDHEGAYASGCLTRGKVERCASRIGSGPVTRAVADELKALDAIRDALVDGVKVPLL